MNKVKPFLAILLTLMTISCAKDEESSFKNIETVYEEQGVPVKVRRLERQDFSTFLTYTSTVKGIKESTGSSLVSDTVEEVLVDVGDYVEKNQIIIRFPKTNPSANYYQSRAGYLAAEKAFRRIENLYESNGVSKQKFEDVKTQYEVQKANWTTVNDMVEVKAPLSGYITRLNVLESENVHPGDSLFTISNFDILSSVVWVADHEIRQIEKGQKASLEWEGTTLNGTVTQVDLAKDMMKKAFAVQIQFINEGHEVPSGVTAEINIETSLKKNAIVLHRKEILSNQNNWYVYINENGFAKQKIIEPGLRQGMYYQIVKGLKPAETLVTEGLSLVRENSRLKIIDDGYNPVAFNPKN